MGDFSVWFTTGLEHILNRDAIDHILFITALCGVYAINDWKKLLILITAFTIGHSLTLALSTLNILRLSTGLVEFLIPLTILCTSLYHLIRRNRPVQGIGWSYAMALFFGCIHGLGFSILLRSMLGKEAHILWPLLSFNLGIEAGQLVIVSVVIIISLVLNRLLRISRPDWNFFISSAVFGIALLMALERLRAL